MVPASMEARILDLVMSFSSRSRKPVIEVNSPNTFEIIMCLTLNWAVSERDRSPRYWCSLWVEPRQAQTFRVRAFRHCLWRSFYSPALTLSVITTTCPVCIRSAEQSGPICDRGKHSRTTEFQIAEKGILHWNQRTEVSRFRRRSEPSDVSLQKSKGNSVRATRRSSLRIFPQPLSFSISFTIKDLLDKAECRQFKTFRV